MYRRIVIDACVASSAGETSEDPTSRCCREFLEEVLQICHRMVLTSELRREWNDHCSPFALRWWATMESRRMVERVEEKRDIRPDISSSARSSSTRKAMLKDAHLIGAAMATDNVIASRDDRAHTQFSEIASKVKGLGKVAWVPIDEDDGDALRWLRAGARAEPRFRLGLSAVATN
jgi:hypothetical protein